MFGDQAAQGGGEENAQKVKRVSAAEDFFIFFFQAEFFKGIIEKGLVGTGRKGNAGSEEKFAEKKERRGCK